jgi:hypothetical protein
MLSPVRMVVLPTSAGKGVHFRNGVAHINDTDDLPYLLARSDARLDITEYAMSWMPEVLARTRVINASVHWPEGYDVRHTSETDFSITPVVPPVEPEEDPLEEALATRPHGKKPRAE